MCDSLVDFEWYSCSNTATFLSYATISLSEVGSTADAYEAVTIFCGFVSLLFGIEYLLAFLNLWLQ